MATYIRLVLFLGGGGGSWEVLTTFIVLSYLTSANLFSTCTIFFLLSLRITENPLESSAWETKKEDKLWHDLKNN